MIAPKPHIRPRVRSQNVVRLVPQRLAPNPDLVRWLEDLLDDARRGEVRGVLGVVAWHDGAFSQGAALAEEINELRATGELFALAMRGIARWDPDFREEVFNVVAP